eukprot:4927009-Pyramimonas_sp.AAC.2
MCRNAQLHDEFRALMPELLPRIVGALAEAERAGEFETVHHALHALEVFSASVEEHLHLVLPAMVQLFQVTEPDRHNKALAQPRAREPSKQARKRHP